MMEQRIHAGLREDAHHLLALASYETGIEKAPTRIEPLSDDVTHASGDGKIEIGSLRDIRNASAGRPCEVPSHARQEPEERAKQCGLTAPVRADERPQLLAREHEAGGRKDRAPVIADAQVLD